MSQNQHDDTFLYALAYMGSTLVPPLFGLINVLKKIIQINQRSYTMQDVLIVVDMQNDVRPQGR